MLATRPDSDPKMNLPCLLPATSTPSASPLSPLTRRTEGALLPGAGNSTGQRADGNPSVPELVGHLHSVLFFTSGQPGLRRGNWVMSKRCDRGRNVVPRLPREHGLGGAVEDHLRAGPFLTLTLTWSSWWFGQGDGRTQASPLSPVCVQRRFTGQKEREPNPQSSDSVGEVWSLYPGDLVR